MNRPFLQLGLVVLILSMALPGSADPTTDLEKEEEAVRAADLELAERVAARNVEGFKALIAADAVFLGARVARGPDQVAADWARYFDPESGQTLEWAPVEVTVAGSAELAFSIGNYVYRQRIAEGEPRVASGEYLTVWRKNELGRWQVVADGPLVTRDPVPPEFNPGLLHRLARSWAPLNAPEAAVTYERQPLQVGIAQAEDLAYTFGRYTLRATDAAGRAERASGAFIMLWTRSGEGPWQAVAGSLLPPRPEAQP